MQFLQQEFTQLINNYSAIWTWRLHINSVCNNSLILYIYIIIRKYYYTNSKKKYYYTYFVLIHAFYIWFWNNFE